MNKNEFLAKTLEELNQSSNFLTKSLLFSYPSIGFSYSESLPEKALKAALNGTLNSVEECDVIGILCDWSEISEGIFFTVDAMYVDSPKNSPKKFVIKYDEIQDVKYRNELVNIYYSDGRIYTVNHKMYNKENIYFFLKKARSYCLEELSRKKNDADRVIDSTVSGGEAAGVVYGSVSNASTIYLADKFNTPRGHGFAAEQMNHLYDKITLKNAELVGDAIDPKTGHIIKDGADRIVNGVNIQTKFCSSGGKCVAECFRNGEFRYFNPDGTPMQVEVPRDMYDAAVKSMEERIAKGEIKGVTDVNEAKKIIRKSKFTYAQAKNVAKAGTIESITFDAVNGMVVATNAFGITVALSFATSVWNGEDFDIALKNSVYSGLKVGGTALVTSIISGQLVKAGLNSALVGSSEALVNIMGPKASAVIANSLRSSTNIYGAAAMKSAAKIFRSNFITGTASVIVLSSVDVANIFSGKISGAQLFKNLVNTTVTVAGGFAGFTAGAAIGSIVPGIGTAIGGLVGLAGSFVAGSAASKASKKVMDNFIEDDANMMVEILQKVFQRMAEDYLITKDEAENITDELQKVLTGKILKEMYASGDREVFAYNLMLDMFENEAKKRPLITLPSNDEFVSVLKNILEEYDDTSLVGINDDQNEL